MGEGLLSRLYFYIRKLKSNDKAPVLISKDFSRVRAKVEKSFPDIPEFTKVLFFIHPSTYIIMYY